MSPRFAPGLFGLVLSALKSFFAPGSAIFRNAVLVDGFSGLWVGAWLTSRIVAFPTVLVMAPVVRRLVGVPVKAHARQVP